MKIRSPFHTSPPRKADSNPSPPTSTSPATMQASPSARAGVMRSPSSTAASSAVHSGRLPGISTEACAAGAKKKPA